jgi:phage gp46-like protein
MTATSSALQLADLALVWGTTTSADLTTSIDDDLASDAGLETACLLSLFTDRRAESDDVPPSGDPNDRRGWWADQFMPVEGDRIGSRRWLLDRSKRTNEVVRRAEEYDREALAWMIEDSVVASIDLEYQLTTDALLTGVTLHRPGQDAVSFRFAHTWEGMEGS